MDTLTTTELREELKLHDLAPAQMNAIMNDAQEHGQVTFTSPATGRAVTVVADDDLQMWGYLA